MNCNFRHRNNNKSLSTKNASSGCHRKQVLMIVLVIFKEYLLNTALKKQG